LGPQPGEGATSPLEAASGPQDLIQAGSSPSSPRVPASLSGPGRPIGAPEAGLPILPEALPRAEIPVFGRLALPTGPEEEGPATGLTLDAAIETLIRNNLDLRAKAYEIPMAQADILTASLRANPLFFADSQLIPYGNYTPERPGGQTQYDININYPLDVTRKRQARTRVAYAAKRIVEAQYQDAVRLAINELYNAYVDALAARETVRLSEASVEGLREVVRITEEQQKRGAKTGADVRKVEVQLRTAEIALAEAKVAYDDAIRNLGLLLGLPAGQTFELRGTLRDPFNPPPPVSVLTQRALQLRPDLNAFRLGITRATEEYRLARANRLNDLYLLYQPYTFQNNEPIGLKSPHSWAVGLTVPLPIYNRNQGNIQRAKWNVAQSQVELEDRERRIIAEVERAVMAYSVTRQSVDRFEREVLPASNQTLETALRLYRLGEEGLLAFLVAQSEYNANVRQYYEALVRHRRSMLQLNTTIGERVLP
jgi:cobalt-zinc-cadmium efflux system outer membrane protein